jgi:hypothetical protein
MKANGAVLLWRRPGAVALLIFVLALAVRLPGLGSFMTVDEENWMLRSAGFWHELFRNGNPGGTFMTTHPGATTMWLAGAGISWQEARLGFDIDTSNLRHFRLVATVPIALTTAALIGLSGWLLSRLFGLLPGGMAGLVLAIDPYLVGMSQIAHLDALLALFMMVAVLAFLTAGRQPMQSGRWLVLSGSFAGLALATKFLPALWLFVFFAAVLAVHSRRLTVLIRVLGFVGGVALLALYAVWPALWVKDDFLHSFERDVPAVVTQEHVALEMSEQPTRPAGFYVRTLLGRTTPFVLILSLGVVGTAARYWLRERRVPTVAWLAMYALGFLALITLAAKKADRYALPPLAMLPVLAGWAFGIAVLVWRRRRAARFLLGIVAVLLTAQTFLWSPYAMAYNNPFFPNIRPFSQQGWGEGLDAAARWLNEHPLADKLTVASWYPGVLGTYFDGKTMSLSSRDDDRVGFVVLYRNMLGRARDDIASNVLDEFRGQEPEHIVLIDDKPYALIFNTIGIHYFPEHAGELIGQMEVGQTVPVEIDGWSSIEIGLATFSGRRNTADVILHVRSDPDAADDIRTVTVNAGDIEDRSWHRFEFQAIAGSSGKNYYVALTSPASTAGNAVTAWFAPEDILPGQLLLRRRERRSGERNSDFFRAGDLAYRLPK